MTAGIPAPGSGRSETFLYGYYGCGNLGDELLLSAVAAGIAERWPSARFRVRNLGRTAAEPGIAGRIVETGLEREMVRRDRSAPVRAAAYLTAAWRLLAGCRCFVLGGGTLIHAKGSLGSLALLTALVVMARARGADVVGLGLGVAHLDRPLARILARIVCALSRDLAVRDSASRDALGPGSGARLCADLVYGWWPRALTEAPATPQPVVAVSLWSIAPAGEAAALAALAAALVRAAQRGCRIRALVLQDDEDGTLAGLSDRPAVARLAALLAERDVTVEVMRPASEPAAIAGAFAGVAAHCGARFHAAVVASLLGVPSVGLATDPKVTSLCRHFGFPALTLDGIDGDRLAAALDAACSMRVDAARLDDMRRRSVANFAWFDARREPAAAFVQTKAG